MLLWVLLPPGLMPVTGAGGWPAFALCTGEGPVMMVAGAEGVPEPARDPEGSGHERQPCPFAAAAHLALAAPLSGPAPVALTLAGPVAPPAEAGIAPARYTPTPPSRAPPAVS